MNNKSRKYLRFWSVLLTLVMVLSLMPVSVFADDEPSGDDITVTEELSEVETTVTILLPEGFTADEAYEEGEYLVVRSAVDTEGKIAPVKIIP